MIEELDALCSSLNMEIISLIDKDEDERIKMMKSLDLSQVTDTCQGSLGRDFISTVLDGNGDDDKVSHVIVLTFNKLLISFALLTEKLTEMGAKYMYIDVLCARKHSSVGKTVLSAAESFSLRRGIKFTSLSSLFESIGFYSKMGYHSIPIEETCLGPSDKKVPFNAVIEFAKEAKEAIDTGDYVDNGIALTRQEEDIKANDVLLKMGFTDDQILFLNKTFKTMMDKWIDIFQDINIHDYFDTPELIMSKCLLDRIPLLDTISSDKKRKVV